MTTDCTSIQVESPTVQTKIEIRDQEHFEALKAVIEASTEFSFKGSPDTEIREVKQKLDKYQDDINKLENENLDLQDYLEDKESKVEELEETNESLRTKRQELVAEKAKLEKKIEELEPELQNEQQTKPEQQEGDKERSEPDEEDSTTLAEFREKTGKERTKKIRAVIKQHGPLKRTEVGEILFDKEVTSTDTEYGDLCNYWPDDAAVVETDDTDGRTKTYVIKEDSAAPEEADETPNSEPEDDQEESEKNSGTNLSDDPHKLHGSQGEFNSLQEFEDLNREKQKKYLLRIVRKHQPVTVEGLARKMFDNADKQERNSIEMKLERYDEGFEKEELGSHTQYWIFGHLTDLNDGAYRLNQLGSDKSKAYICTNCRSSDGVFDTLDDARNHKLDMGCDSWVTTNIPLKKWRTDETVERIVEKKTVEVSA